MRACNPFLQFAGAVGYNQASDIRLRPSSPSPASLLKGGGFAVVDMNAPSPASCKWFWKRGHCNIVLNAQGTLLHLTSSTHWAFHIMPPPLVDLKNLLGNLMGLESRAQGVAVWSKTLLCKGEKCWTSQPWWLSLPELGFCSIKLRAQFWRLPWVNATDSAECLVVVLQACACQTLLA